MERKVYLTGPKVFLVRNVLKGYGGIASLFDFLVLLNDVVEVWESVSLKRACKFVRSKRADSLSICKKQLGKGIDVT